MNAALASVLRESRGGLNERFAQARRRMPTLDGAAFGELLVRSCEPLVAQLAPADLSPVVIAVYDVTLELVGQKLLERDPRLGEVWVPLLTASAPMLAQAPERVLASLANALVALGGTPGARPEAWARAMGELAPQLGADLSRWLTCGQVLAWWAGLAHFRQSALALCDKLPPELALALLGGTGLAWPEVRERLARDPWYVPGRPPHGLAVMARVGAFRGLGGLFAAPPRLVGASEHHFFVQDGADTWVLCADVAGATWHRTAAGEVPSSPGGIPPGSQLEGARLTLGQKQFELPVHGPVTSAAAVRGTIAVTSAHSHAVVLLAVPE